MIKGRIFTDTYTGKEIREYHHKTKEAAKAQMERARQCSLFTPGWRGFGKKGWTVAVRFEG